MIVYKTVIVHFESGVEYAYENVTTIDWEDGCLALYVDGCWRFSTHVEAWEVL